MRPAPGRPAVPVGRRTPARARTALAWCQWLTVAGIAWTAHALMESLPYWPSAASISTDIWVSFRIDFLRALWAVLPAPILWGASVPLALAAAAEGGGDPGRSVGGVCAANTAGAIAGALGSSLFLVASIGSQHTQQLMMGVASLAALCAWGSGRGQAEAPSEVGRVLSDPAAAVGPKGPTYVRIGAVAVGAVLMTMVPPLPGVLVAYGRNA